MIITIHHPQQGEVSMVTWAQSKDLLTLVGSLQYCQLDLRQLLPVFLQEVVSAIGLTALPREIPVLIDQTGEIEVCSYASDVLKVLHLDAYPIATLLNVFWNLSWNDAHVANNLFMKHFAFEDLDAPTPLSMFNLTEALLARVEAAGVSMPRGAYNELVDAYEDVDLRLLKELYTESAPTVEFLVDLYAYDSTLYLVDELGTTLMDQPKARKYMTLTKTLTPGWPHSRTPQSYSFKVCDLGLDMGYVTWTDPAASDMLPQPGYVIRISEYLKGD